MFLLLFLLPSETNLRKFMSENVFPKFSSGSFMVSYLAFKSLSTNKTLFIQTGRGLELALGLQFTSL